jgi:hypothetical protein
VRVCISVCLSVCMCVCRSVRACVHICLSVCRSFALCTYAEVVLAQVEAPQGGHARQEVAQGRAGARRQMVPTQGQGLHAAPAQRLGCVCMHARVRAQQGLGARDVYATLPTGALGADTCWRLV